MKLFIPSRVLLYVIFYFLVFIGLSKCSKFENSALPKKLTQPTLNNEELRRLVLLDTSFTYPLSLATNDVKIIALKLDKEDKFNSSPRTIKKIMTANEPDISLSSKQDKSGARNEDVPEVYVFLFNDNRGFALGEF